MKNCKPKKLTDNPHFCIVPWVHTYLSPQSERRLCCASREESSFVQQYLDQPGSHGSKYTPIELAEHWNSEKMKNIRLRMLSGESLPECSICDASISSLSTYRNWFTNQLFGDLVNSIEEKTAPDGSTELLPISFDYRFNNTCNFKCRTCGDQFSSAWEVENRSFGDYSNQSIPAVPWLFDENREKINEFQKEVVEAEFSEAVESKRIREIYWVGGEPLVWPQHWKYMKRIVELGYASKVFARYNTNLSRIENNGLNLFSDILKHFDRYMVSASIDGAGKIGEFIRTGLVWEKWIKNFEEGVTHSKGRDDTSMMFDVTLSLPSLFSVEELLEHALRLDVRMEVKVMYGFDPFVILHPLAVPGAVLRPFLNNLIKKIEKKVKAKQMPLLNTLVELAKRPTFEEQFPESFKSEFHRGRKYLLRVGSRRSDGEGARLSYEKIYAENPGILDWWNQQN